MIVTRAFADTAYFIALLIDRDAHHERALAVGESILETVTIQPVLVEVCAFVSDRGPTARLAAATFIDTLRINPTVTVVPQTPELFDEGMALFRSRPDKGYSLTDCMSMVVCRRMAIEDVLTSDHHFEQEGFRALLR